MALQPFSCNFYSITQFLSFSQASYDLEVVFGRDYGTYQGANINRSLFPKASQKPLPERNGQCSSKLREGGKH